MATGYAICRNRYLDSVFLMHVSNRIAQEAGIDQAVVLMATRRNKLMLAELGFNSIDVQSAEANDLIVALKGPDQQQIGTIINDIDSWLVRKPSKIDHFISHSIEEAISIQPNTSLVVISIPGSYAVGEAYKALERGMNVFLFSGNISIDDELSLKRLAQDRGLIVMGPDCGTAIISGVGLGFANKVRRGPIGVVAASGTGLQEFTSLVHQRGSGISHAIGTGGRDPSDAIEGISIFSGITALQDDPSTDVITVISKPPGAKTLPMMIDVLNQCSKPVVACFLGSAGVPSQRKIRFKLAKTIDDTVYSAIELATAESILAPEFTFNHILTQVDEECSGMAAQQKYIRGIFAGGTFCYQSQQVMKEKGVIIYSNAPLDGMEALLDPYQSKMNSFIDMGADLFTENRPHPMIDATLRKQRIQAEAQDPKVAVLLLDFILGYNASPDPVGDLLECIGEAKENVRKQGGFLSVVASVCGTDEDPQDLKEQVKSLKDAGVVVMPSNALAALFSREIILRRQA